MQKILVNKIKCNKYGDVIESNTDTILNIANVVRWLSMVEKII